jgi:hypothetical protein
LNDKNVNIGAGRSAYEKVVAQRYNRKSVDYSLKGKPTIEQEAPTEKKKIDIED